MTELKEIFNSIKKHWKFIIGFTALILVIAIILQIRARQKYEVNFSLLISEVKTQRTKEFKYDSYYALKAKSKIGDYLMGILQSPEVVAQILKSSKIQNNIAAHKLRTFFHVYKSSDQSIGIVFFLKNPSSASVIGQNVIETANSYLAKAYYPDTNDAQFLVRTTNPLVSLKKPHLGLNSVIVLFVSFILLSLIALFKDYWSSS